MVEGYQIEVLLKLWLYAPLFHSLDLLFLSLSHYSQILSTFLNKAQFSAA